MATQTTVDPRVELRTPPVTGIATVPHTRVKLRKGLFGAALAVVPAAVGAAVGTLARSKRAGALVGGIVAGGMLLARWQLQRLINDEPAYEEEQRIGDLELRSYAPHVIARTVLDDDDFDLAQQQGFDRLAGYLFGASSTGEELAMTGPVEISHENGSYAMTFVMPPGRTLASLPQPTDPRVRLQEVPARRIAVLCYRGRYTGDVVEERGAELLREVAKAGLSAKGRPMFAGFDPPTTAPLLRRNEMWVEIV